VTARLRAVAPVNCRRDSCRYRVPAGPAAPWCQSIAREDRSVDLPALFARGRVGLRSRLVCRSRNRDAASVSQCEGRDLNAWTSGRRRRPLATLASSAAISLPSFVRLRLAALTRTLRERISSPPPFRGTVWTLRTECSRHLAGRRFAREDRSVDLPALFARGRSGHTVRGMRFERMDPYGSGS